MDDLAAVTGQLLERADNESVPSFNTVFDYDKRDMEEGHVGYYDFSQMMEMRLDADAYVAWKNVFDASIVYWNTTDKNYSMFKRMFSKEQTALRIISPFRLIPKLLRLTVPWLGIKLRDSKIWVGSM